MHPLEPFGAGYRCLESAHLTWQMEDQTEPLREELLGSLRESELEALLADGRLMSLEDAARFVLADGGAPV